MGAVVGTAQRGRGARGGLLARAALRLLALLGFACVAVILSSTASNADSCAGSTCHESPSASKPGLLPGLLRTTSTVLHPVLSPAHADAPASDPSGTATADIATTGVATAAQHAVTATPAAHLASVLAILGSAAHGPRDGTPAAGPPAVGALSLHDTLTPVVGSAAQAVSNVVDAVSSATSPLPVLGSVTALLRSAGTATADLVVSTVNALTTQVDAGLTRLTSTVAVLVAPLTGGAGRRTTAGSSSVASSAGSSAQPTGDGSTTVAPVGIRGAAPRTPSTPTGRIVLSSAPGSVGAVSAVPSVPTAVAASAAPALGAGGTALGSTPGTAVGGSSGLHEQTEVPGGFDVRTVLAIGRPAATVARPLPGSPLIDPGFSPD